MNEYAIQHKETGSWWRICEDNGFVLEGGLRQNLLWFACSFDFYFSPDPAERLLGICEWKFVPVCPTENGEPVFEGWMFNTRGVRFGYHCQVFARPLQSEGDSCIFVRWAKDPARETWPITPELLRECDIRL